MFCFIFHLALLLLDKVESLLVENSSSAKLHVSKAISGKIDVWCLIVTQYMTDLLVICLNSGSMS